MPKLINQRILNLVSNLQLLKNPKSWYNDYHSRYRIWATKSPPPSNCCVQLKLDFRGCVLRLWCLCRHFHTDNKAPDLPRVLLTASPRSTAIHLSRRHLHPYRTLAFLLTFTGYSLHRERLVGPFVRNSCCHRRLPSDPQHSV